MKKFITIIILMILLMNSSLLLVISTAIDNVINQIEIEPLKEIKLEKYVNYDFNNNRGVMVKLNLKTGIEYKNDVHKPLKSSQILLNTAKINEEYPEKIEVVGKSTKVTNGGDNAKDYEPIYDKESGKIVIITSNNEDENGNIYSDYNENARDEYDIILYYSSNCYNNENEERVLDFTGTVRETLADEYETNVDSGIEESYKVAQNISSVISTEISTSEIYNGYINANVQNGTNIDTQYTENINVNLDYKEISDEIQIMTNNKFINTKEEQIDTDEIIYKNTRINKNDVLNKLGEDGYLRILNDKGEILGEINKDTEVSQEDGTVEITYNEEIHNLIVKMSKPIQVGDLLVKSTKEIKSTMTDMNNKKIKVESVINCENNVVNTVENAETHEMVEETTQQQVYEFKDENITEIKDAVTESKLEINKDKLSTVISNDVEIKAILLSNNEKYNLYKNPQITIELPEQVEGVTINSVDLLYENELKIANYEVNGRNINIKLEGIQSQYKKDVVEGTIIVVNATLNVNKKSATADSEIRMNYVNEYASGEVGVVSRPIKIVAPKELTTVYSIQDLGIETIGQEETKEVMLEKSANEKEVGAQIEVINNNENSIENVKILGDFPTNNDENNMNIEMISGISLSGTENARIYYSENKEATDDIENTENGWSESIENGKEVNKYLIVVDEIVAQSSVKGEYTYKIPANLEYNQVAKTKYMVKNTNSETKVESEMVSTEIAMETGIGPNVETKLIATKGGKEIEGPVKNGEVIRYDIEVSNTGTEDVQNVVVRGQVPEGTTMVVPEDDYEYTDTYYYQEVEDKTYEATIENLKVGEVVHSYYEVRVDIETAPETELNNIVETTYEEVTKQSNEIQNITEKGNIRVTVKRVTDRKIELYPGKAVSYAVIVENISGEVQENIKIKTNLSEDLSVSELEIITGRENGKATENATREEIEYSDEIDIGSLKPKEDKILMYTIKINKMQNNEPISFSVIAGKEQEAYVSNNWQDNAKSIDVGISMTANTQSEYVKAGDIIEYTIEINNKTGDDIGGTFLSVVDSIPNQLTIKRITNNDQEITGKQGNELTIPITLESNGTSIIKIETVVDYSSARDQAETITNIATIEYLGTTIATTSAINHIIQANDVENTDPSGDQNDDNNQGDNNNSGDNNTGNGNEGSNNNVDNNDIAQGNGIISGVAWYDENANGQRDQNESTLNNVKVKLLNTETNNLVKDTQENVLEASTNDDGIYVLDKIGNGKYIVVFEYDNVQYGLTKYKVEGVSEAKNSNAILNELLIENEKKEVVSTDIIEINNNNISNINIGLIKLKNFDLKLDKYVSRVLIQNTNGTTVIEYNNAKLVKAEIPGKNLNGSTVIIEYRINVTNNGEVEGYAKKIADYVPSDLKFDSKLNRGWYQSGNIIYTDSLANEKIKAGETKTVTLTLTKAMTENNTGSTSNSAEIVEDYNELGIKDSNSTPGNRKNTENDYSIAETIISVKTGEIVYIGIVIGVIVVLGIVAVIIRRKKNKIKEQ